MYLGLYTYADVYFKPMYHVTRPIYSCRRIFHANVSRPIYSYVDAYFMPMFQCIKAYILIQMYFSCQCINVSRPIYSCIRIFQANLSMYQGLYTHADYISCQCINVSRPTYYVYVMPMYRCIRAYILMQTYISCPCINVSMYLGLYTHADVYVMPMYRCI